MCRGDAGISGAGHKNEGRVGVEEIGIHLSSVGGFLPGPRSFPFADYYFFTSHYTSLQFSILELVLLNFLISSIVNSVLIIDKDN